MDIIDDHTSMTWAIPLKLKSDAFLHLKAWTLAREEETRLKVGLFCIDNGELKSNEFEEWCRSRGTTIQFMAPYTSAHNGRVERLHRTLMAKARTVRIYVNMPAYLWDEFYLTAAHLHQKTTTRSLNNGPVPWERWYNRKPDYSYMREIGCRAFVLIQNKHNPKIYEQSIECVLIEYDVRSKSYRCYDKKTRSVYSSYHVQFLEMKDGHPPKDGTVPITDYPEDFQTIKEIQANATKQSSYVESDQEEYHLPNEPFITAQTDKPPVIPQPEGPFPDIKEPGIPELEHADAVEEEPIIPRRSTRSKATVETNQDRLQKVVQESKESAPNG